MSDPVALRRALQDERRDELVARLRRLLAPLTGNERALDVGCGTGAFAYALAPLVGEVVGVDSSEEYLASAREHAPEGCRFVMGNAESLDFPYGDFDLVGCLRVLHHVRRPGARRLRARARHAARRAHRDRRPARRHRPDPQPRGRPVRAARDPSHTRLLPDADIRGFLDANDLVVTANEVVRRSGTWRATSTSPGSRGGAERVARMAPAHYEVEIGWYVARKP